MMEAGRELDALVAEEVMGAACPPQNPKEVYDEITNIRYGHSAETEHWQVNFHINGGPRWMYRGPHYSTEIVDAWKVFITVLTLNRYIRGFVGVPAGSVNFKAHFFDERYGKELGCSYQPNSAHAICLAALQAVEVISNE